MEVTSIHNKVHDKVILITNGSCLDYETELKLKVNGWSCRQKNSYPPIVQLMEKKIMRVRLNTSSTIDHPASLLFFAISRAVKIEFWKLTALYVDHYSFNRKLSKDSRFSFNKPAVPLLA